MKPRKRRSLRLRRRSRSRIDRGRQDGYRSGWHDGHWLGLCEAAMVRTQFQPVKREAHVLFISSGKGYPYSPLDQSIAATLEELVTRVTILQDRAAAAATVGMIRPDLVLVLDGLDFPLEEAAAIRSQGIRTAVWFTDDPYYTDMTAGIAVHYDHVFTLEKNCVDFYQALGCPSVHYLPLAADPRDFRPRLAAPAIRRDASFIGSGYWNRVAFFDQSLPYIADKNILISGIWWDRLRHYGQLAHRIELGKWRNPLETSLVYNGSKIVINLHRAHDDATFNYNSAGLHAVSPNPRMFEISACATLQLTDIRSDLASHYIPGVEIETYGSPEELAEKINFYLANEEARRRIALRGLYRTMRDHTYVRRLSELLTIAL